MRRAIAVQDYHFAILDIQSSGNTPEPQEGAPSYEALEALVELRVCKETEKIRAQAFLEGQAVGFSDGVAAAKDDFEQHENQLLRQLVDSLKDAEDRLNAAMTEVETSFVSALKVLVRRLAPRLLDAGYGARLEDIVSDAMTRTRADTALELRLNSSDAARYGEKIMALAASRHRVIEVIGMARIPVGSCDLRWGLGGVRFDGREMLEALSAVLDDNDAHLKKEVTT